MRTFVPHDVRPGDAGSVLFSIEHETVGVEYGPDSTCRRCRKPFRSEAPIPVITATQVPLDPVLYTWLMRTRWPMAPRTHYKVGLYHGRCVPPNVFHAAAGSRPAPGRSRVVPADAVASPPRAARLSVSGSAIAASFAGIALALTEPVHADIREPKLTQVFDGEAVDPVLGTWSVSLTCAASARDALVEHLERDAMGLLSFPDRGRQRQGQAFLLEMRTGSQELTLEFQGTGALE